jgi:predicted dehydrogenase
LEKLKVAILGCGPRGNSQAAAWQKLPGAELVALCDLNAERLEAAGAKFGVERLYRDLDEMFARERLDVVCVPARADWHFPLAMAVLERGVNCIVEKPIAIDLQQADAMVATARRNGARLAVHHQLSVGPLQRKAKELLEHGAIGSLRSIRGAGKGYYGGFGLMETGTHVLDQMRNLGGTVSWIQARVTVRGRDATAEDVAQAPRGLGLVAGDNITAYYAFRSGVYGIGEFFYRPKMDSRAYAVDLSGTEGTLCLRSGSGSGLYLQRDPVWHPTSPVPWEELRLTDDELRVPGTDLVTADAGVWMAQEMVNAIREDRDHVCSGEAGLHALEMILGTYASHAQRGARAALPLVDREHPLASWCRSSGGAVPELRILTDTEYMEAELRREPL